MNAHFRLKCDESFWVNAHVPLKCEGNIRMNAHFLLKSDKGCWQSLLSNAEDYELLVVKEFDDACSVHKQSSSVSNPSMISCSRLVDFNPTFGIHPCLSMFDLFAVSTMSENFNSVFAV